MIRLTQIDGKLPNLALMRLSAHHKARGQEVFFTKSVYRDMLEPEYEHVYGSAIFASSADRVALFKREFPEAIAGGSWSVDPVTKRETGPKVEEIIGSGELAFDYDIYPNFEASIGFTQRGCRLKCGFCSVPQREGAAQSISTIKEIWRGEGYPRHLHLLDNDFFGQPRDQWEARIDEIKAGGFKVSLNQGINIRFIDDQSAAALASIPYYDDGFTKRRLYTAWDNIGDEERFFNGVQKLEEHGIPPTHLMVYMLTGYDQRETWERVFHRFNRMTALGIRPYPMVYQNIRDRTLPLGDGVSPRLATRTLGEFQRWVIRKAYNFIPFEEYNVNARGAKITTQAELFAEA